MTTAEGKMYKLVNAPSMFKDWIGHIFKVIKVDKFEITLKEANSEESNDAFYYACIAVSPDEFAQYFDEVPVKQPVKKKVVKEDKPAKKCKAGKWSEWKTFKMYGITYAFKENGKNVIVRSGGYRGCSKCHSEDEFNLEYGLRLAMSRLIQNKAKAEQAQKDYLAKHKMKKAKEQRDNLEELLERVFDGW